MVKADECVRLAIRTANKVGSADEAHGKGAALGRSISAKLKRADKRNEQDRTFRSEVEIAFLALAVGHDAHLDEVVFGALEGLGFSDGSLPLIQP